MLIIKKMCMSFALTMYCVSRLMDKLLMSGDTVVLS